MDEQVLVVPAATVARLGAINGLRRGAELLPRLLESSELQFRPRSEVETDPSFKQLIPYVVFRCRDRVFHYTRGASGSESRLHALKSVGVGGHINPVDAGSADAYRAGMMRELAEEVVIESPYRESVLGLIYDPATPVGEVHLGVVHLLDLERQAVRPCEKALTGAGFAPLAELHAERDRFESWSRFVLDTLING